MKVIRTDRESLSETMRMLGSEKGLHLAIGFFDGIHLGHQRILADLKACAARSGHTCAALSFDPHPLSVAARGRAPKSLMTLDDKIRIMDDMGIDSLILLKFDESLRRMTPGQFVSAAFGRMRMPLTVFVGYNFTFGSNASGTAATLSRLGQKHGFKVRIFDPVTIGGVAVSSTAIRQHISEGRLRTAAELLGRPYILRAEVEWSAAKQIGLYLSSSGQALPCPGKHPCAMLVLSRAPGEVEGLLEIDPEAPESGRFSPGLEGVREGEAAALRFGDEGTLAKLETAAAPDEREVQGSTSEAF